MRPSVLLLLLVNLVTLAFTQLPAADARRDGEPVTQRELHADKVTITHRTPASPVQAEPLDVKPEKTAEQDQQTQQEEQTKHEQQTVYLAVKSPPAPVCLEWAGIAAHDLNRSRTVLDSLGVTYRASHGDRPTEFYWVNIPGLQTLAAAESLAARLKAEGQRNFALSRTTAQGIYSISLGVFKNEESANRLQERFLRLGARVTPYAASTTTYMIEAGSAVAEKVSAAAAEFDQTTVKVVDCPEIRTG